MEVVTGAADPAHGDGATAFYLVRKVAAVNWQRPADSPASASTRTAGPAVMFTLKPDGARKFGQVTGSNIGRSLAIILDDRVQSYARIDGRITSDGRISGGFTQEEAADLALMLRSGALPASMTYLEERVDRPDAWRRLDSLGRQRGARGPRPGRASSCSSTTSCRASTRSSRWSST